MSITRESEELAGETERNLQDRPRNPSNPGTIYMKFLLLAMLLLCGNLSASTIFTMEEDLESPVVAACEEGDSPERPSGNSRVPSKMKAKRKETSPIEIARHAMKPPSPDSTSPKSFGQYFEKLNKGMQNRRKKWRGTPTSIGFQRLQ